MLGLSFLPGPHSSPRGADLAIRISFRRVPPF
jgi:hypothetical protein